MQKELIITLIVIVLIVIGNIVTQNNTNEAVKEVTAELVTLKDEMSKELVSKENSKQQMEKIQELWRQKYETMAYYVEHAELEKVESELVKLKANIDMEEYQTGVESLDNCSFILKHIKDKSALKIVNIF